jgi:hypothetical protein
LPNTGIFYSKYVASGILTYCSLAIVQIYGAKVPLTWAAILWNKRTSIQPRSQDEFSTLTRTQTRTRTRTLTNSRFAADNIGVRESTTRTTCDSVNPYFGVWLRVQGLTRSFRRPAIWARSGVGFRVLEKRNFLKSSGSLMLFYSIIHCYKNWRRFLSKSCQ